MTNPISAAFRMFIVLACFWCGSLYANAINVNSTSDDTADDGSCTLREAIIAANTDTPSGAMSGECVGGSGGGGDIIFFTVAGTIQPNSALPTVTSQIHFNGYTAPGSSKNTNPLAQGTNAQLTVEIDGVNAGNVPGLALSGPFASGSIIEGLVINNSVANPDCCAQDGIYIVNVNVGTPIIIRGNFIGTDMTGTQRRPKGSRGIYIETSANVIVGTGASGEVDPASVNLVSGSDGNGISIDQASNIRVRGNLVGTNAAGTAGLHNSSSGVGLDTTSSSWVQDNVISGNNSSGIRLRGNSSAVDFERNIIGRNAANTGAIPNGFGGIYVSENFNSSSASILDMDFNENVVASNLCGAGCGGITIGESNSVNTVQGIRLSRNRIFDNQNLEIDLGVTNGTNNGLVYGATPNDPDDPDDGANKLQNAPLVKVATANGTQVFIFFLLNSEPSKTFTLEFFHTATCDASDYGGGEVFLGDGEFVTDASGDIADDITLPLSVTTGFITATATNADNGTSEFSFCQDVTNDVNFKDGFENLPPP